MARPFQTLSAAVIGAALGCGALWRATLAVQHYRASSAILDDPSVRELEQVSAIFECGLAVTLLVHALVAASYTRRSLGLNVPSVIATAVVAGTTIGASLSQAPVLGAPGLVGVSLLVTCAVVGYFANHPWASAYLGVVLGSVAAILQAVSELNPFVFLAVSVPAIGFALAGVGLGKVVRLRITPRRAA